MGTLFMVNPPRRKKRRTAAQKRATAKMISANKRKRAKKRRRTSSVATSRRKRKGVATMAKRGRKRSSAKRRTTTRRRRRSVRQHRSPVTKLRRHSVYLTNPRRRRRSRRRSFRRNPAVFAQLKQGAMDAGATLVGGAAARMASGVLPLPKDGLAGVASGLAVALGVGYAARKVVRGDTARFITAGAMQVPIKALITTFVPGAGAFLGDYDGVGTYALPAQSGVGDYLNPGAMYGSQGAGSDVEIGVYE